MASHSAVLAAYRFDAAPRQNSTDTDAGSTASAFSLSGGTATGGSPTQAAISSDTNQPYIRSLSLTSTKAGAIAENDYFSFTLTPTGGSSHDLGLLNFQFGGSNVTSGGADYTAFMSLQASVNGGAFFDVGPEVSRTILFNSTSSPQLSDYSIDLGAVSALQGLTDPVTFRFYLYSSVSTDTNIVRMDNIILNNVPEAGSAALCMVGSLVAVGLRRRAC